MIENEGELKKRIDAKTYQHSFDKCGDILVMTCNDMVSSTQRDKDIALMDDITNVLDEAKQEIYDAWRNEGSYESTLRLVGIALRKWFGGEADEREPKRKA